MPNNIDIAELKRLHSQIANIKLGGIGGRIVNAFPALIARLEAAEAAMQWRPIEEAPKDGKTRILGCGLYNHPFDPAMAESVVFAWVHFNRILGEWVDCHGYYFTPTHYMPLPAPPEAAR
jgi:hypothetical protein